MKCLLSCILFALASCGNATSESSSGPVVVEEDGKRVRTIANEEVTDFFDFSYSLNTVYSDGISDNNYYNSTLTHKSGDISEATTSAKYGLTALKAGFVYYEGQVDVQLNFSNPKYKSDSYGNFTDTGESYPSKTIRMSFTFDGLNTSSINSNTYTGSYEWFKSDSSSRYYTYLYVYSPMDILNEYSVLDSVYFYNSTLRATYIDTGVSGDESLKYQSYQISEPNFNSYFQVLTSDATDNSLKTVTITPIISTLSDANMIDYNDIQFTSNWLGKRTLRRDGTFTKTFTSITSSSNFQIEKASGTVDVYPGRMV